MTFPGQTEDQVDSIARNPHGWMIMGIPIFEYVNRQLSSNPKFP